MKSNFPYGEDKEMSRFVQEIGCDVALKRNQNNQKDRAHWRLKYILFEVVKYRKIWQKVASSSDSKVASAFFSLFPFILWSPQHLLISIDCLFYWNVLFSIIHNEIVIRVENSKSILLFPRLEWHSSISGSACI